MSGQTTETAHLGVGPNNEARCPIPGCSADLYLTITHCVPLYAVDPPWPGAGPARYAPDAAVSDGWEVECTDGHKVWTDVDQIRADNAAGLTDDDETGDSAPTFRMERFAVVYPPEGYRKALSSPPGQGGA